MTAFQKKETWRQARYKQENWPGLADGKHGGRSYSHILPQGHRDKNFYPRIYDPLNEYLNRNRIAWHSSINNLKSSQACCFNFLFPWKVWPVHSTNILANVLPEIQRISAMEFEYTGPDGTTEWLGEPRGGGRGLNRTSVDAAVWWIDKSENRRLTLIEWKYTESSFGGCGGFKSKGNQTKQKCVNLEVARVHPQSDCYVSTGTDDRTSRHYWNLLAAAGIVVSRFAATGCPFIGPWYQLLRLYLLRHYCQQNLPNLDMVDVVVIGFEDNWPHLLKLRPSMKNMSLNVVEGWNFLLNDVPPLRKVSVEEMLLNADSFSEGAQEWRTYIAGRYGV